MSEEVQQRVFTPFFTTKGVGEGTGLGLAISEQIVSSLSGNIRFESELGRGSSFVVALPSRGAETQPPPAFSEFPPPSNAKPRLLVIDDERLILSLVSRAARQRFEVVAVESALEALELHRKGERFDLTLCDLTMPHMSGEEYHRTLRGMMPDSGPLVFMTGAGYSMEGAEGHPSERCDYLRKPFTVDALRNLLTLYES